jgi:hypothetical protein
VPSDNKLKVPVIDITFSTFDLFQKKYPVDAHVGKRPIVVLTYTFDCVCILYDAFSIILVNGIGNDEVFLSLAPIVSTSQLVEPKV